MPWDGKPDFEAIQVRDKFLFAALALCVARWRGLRFFYWLSWPEPESLLARARDCSARYPLIAAVTGRIFRVLLHRWILPRCDHAFVQSQRMKDDICAHGIDPEKLTPVPMGAEVDSLPAASPERRPDDGASFTVGYLGVITAERRLDVLVELSPNCAVGARQLAF